MCLSIHPSILPSFHPSIHSCPSVPITCQYTRQELDQVNYLATQLVMQLHTCSCLVIRWKYIMASLRAYYLHRGSSKLFSPSDAELNPICHLLALLRAAICWHYYELPFVGIITSCHLLALLRAAICWHYYELPIVGIIMSCHLLALLRTAICWHYYELPFVGIITSCHLLALLRAAICWHYYELPFVGIITSSQYSPH